MLFRSFTRGSHHRQNSVIFMTQNIFPQGKYARSISLNSHYLVLFNNRRDKSQIFNLGRQLYPKQSSFFNEIIDDTVCNHPYGHLVVDTKPDSLENLRLRFLDFENDNVIVYIKK